MSLEKDIAVKTNSLFRDRHKCMAHRAHYPTVLQLAGYSGRQAQDYPPRIKSMLAFYSGCAPGQVGLCLWTPSFPPWGGQGSPTCPLGTGGQSDSPSLPSTDHLGHLPDTSGSVTSHLLVWPLGLALAAEALFFFTMPWTVTKTAGTPLSLSGGVRA